MPPPALRTRLLEAAAAPATQAAVIPLRVEPRGGVTRWRMVGSIAAGMVLILAGLLAREWTAASRLGETLASVRQANTDLMTRLDAQMKAGADLVARMDAQTTANASLLARLDDQMKLVADVRRGLEGQGQVLTVLASADTRVARLGAKDEPVRGRVLLDPHSGDAALVIVDLRSLDAAHTYELWAIRGKNAPEPAGLFQPATGTTALRLPRVEDPRSVTAFAVSIEPSGGSSSPTGPVVLVGAVQAS